MFASVVQHFLCVLRNLPNQFGIKVFPRNRFLIRVSAECSKVGNKIFFERQLYFYLCIQPPPLFFFINGQSNFMHLTRKKNVSLSYASSTALNFYCGFLCECCVSSSYDHYQSQYKSQGCFWSFTAHQPMRCCRIFSLLSYKTATDGLKHAPHTHTSLDIFFPASQHMQIWQSKKSLKRCNASRILAVKLVWRHLMPLNQWNLFAYILWRGTTQRSSSSSSRRQIVV